MPVSATKRNPFNMNPASRRSSRGRREAFSCERKRKKEKGTRQTAHAGFPFVIDALSRGTLHGAVKRLKTSVKSDKKLTRKRIKLGHEQITRRLRGPCLMRDRYFTLNAADTGRPSFFGDCVSISSRVD